MKEIRYTITAILLALSASFTTGCDDGVGDDLEDAGDSISDAAEEAGDEVEDATN